MTGVQAISEYCAALNEHNPDVPETKVRVRVAREALTPFLDHGKIPGDLLVVAKGLIK